MRQIHICFWHFVSEAGLDGIRKQQKAPKELTEDIRRLSGEEKKQRKKVRAFRKIWEWHWMQWDRICWCGKCWRSALCCGISENETPGMEKLSGTGNKVGTGTVSVSGLKKINGGRRWESSLSDYPKLENAKKVKKILLEHGFQTVFACSSASAALRDVTGEYSYGLVISGYRMPDMYYLDLVRLPAAEFRIHSVRIRGDGGTGRCRDFIPDHADQSL